MRSHPISHGSIAGYVIEVRRIQDEFGEGFRTSIRSRANGRSIGHTFSTFDSNTEREAKERSATAFLNLRNGNSDRADQKAIYTETMPVRV